MGSKILGLNKFLLHSRSKKPPNWQNFVNLVLKKSWTIFELNSCFLGSKNVQFKALLYHNHFLILWQLKPWIIWTSWSFHETSSIVLVKICLLLSKYSRDLTVRCSHLINYPTFYVFKEIELACVVPYRNTSTYNSE